MKKDHQTQMNGRRYKEDRAVDWSEANSYDRHFGGKYLGYLRRECNGSRFGSYPLHDDYSEDSSPDQCSDFDY
ncbi:MAG TPA: hypothetical protein VE956_23390 [Nodularia sp. (in: cyanobacteria)]|nr:hypothetical protein [Nodularia sp. (in: cyanobacteria)]